MLATEPPQLTLESIMGCLQGVVPSPFATCGMNGMPNITYLSIVQYVDSERVALSRQFMNKSAGNLAENPFGQLLVVDPTTIDQYLLDLEFLGTETEGPAFETMRSNLEGVAAQSGLEGIARLLGVDIHRVLACRSTLPGAHSLGEPPLTLEMLRVLDEFARRLSGRRDVPAAIEAALAALPELLGRCAAVVLVRDGDRLRGVATHGCDVAPSDLELTPDAGLLGVAIARRQVVSVPHLGRSQVMATAVALGDGEAGPEAADSLRALALSRPARIQSVAAVPLIAGGQPLGILYVESERAGAFGAAQERLLRIAGTHLATALTLRPTPTTVTAEPGTVGAGSRAITYYQADDSIFAAGDYVIKGVPGRILWKLLRAHVAEQRTRFTNRELRLDESLGLPPGNDNLDSRLLTLRRRLASGEHGMSLQRVGRGVIELRVDGELFLDEIATAGPMRHAHAQASIGA